MYFEVSRIGFSGIGRIQTDLKFTDREKAQEYANETNFYYPNCDAKVELIN